jgi:CBS domain-containing protein
MGENDVGCVVVEEAGKLCGILTDRDIALKVTGKSKDPKKTKVQEIMTRNPIRISVDESFRELTSLMRTHHVRRVPVVDGIDKVLGIVSMDDFIVRPWPVGVWRQANPSPG